MEAEANNEMRQAAQRVHDHVLKENGQLHSDTIVDAAVSFDGTWAKRGFTSLTGVVFVISVDTGEVLDYHVLSKECRNCVMKKAQCESDACVKCEGASGQRSEDKMVVHFGSPMIPILFRSNV